MIYKYINGILTNEAGDAYKTFPGKWVEGEEYDNSEIDWCYSGEIIVHLKLKDKNEQRKWGQRRWENKFEMK